MHHLQGSAQNVAFTLRQREASCKQHGSAEAIRKKQRSAPADPAPGTATLMLSGKYPVSCGADPLVATQGKSRAHFGINPETHLTPRLPASCRMRVRVRACESTNGSACRWRWRRFAGRWVSGLDPAKQGAGFAKGGMHRAKCRTNCTTHSPAEEAQFASTRGACLHTALLLGNAVSMAQQGREQWVQALRCDTTPAGCQVEGEGQVKSGLTAVPLNDASLYCACGHAAASASLLDGAQAKRQPQASPLYCRKPAPPAAGPWPGTGRAAADVQRKQALSRCGALRSSAGQRQAQQQGQLPLHHEQQRLAAGWGLRRRRQGEKARRGS